MSRTVTYAGETRGVIGAGAPNLDLSVPELREIVHQALSSVACKARVLAIVADKTRDDNTPLLFPFAAEALATRKIDKLDLLIAQGTHAAMTDAEKQQKIGGDQAAAPGLGRIFDHHWSDPNHLVSIGELSADVVRKTTASLLDTPIQLTINRLLAPGSYDTVLIFSSTVPHEVAGFSGGAKYFFPGVAGPELTHATHWLSALATIEQTIGRIETPTRHLIEAAADFVPANVISFNSVLTRDQHGRLRAHALFCGELRQGLRQAADVSRHVHIKYTGRKYTRVIALLDKHYDDLWVGGKASYRLGPVIDNAGELIIYAPHLSCISHTHGHLITKYGYAPLEKIRILVDHSPDLQANLCVAAHLAHVSFASRQLDDGAIVPRYSITLSSQVDEATCRRANLGYMPLQQFRREDYEKDPNTLIVEDAGRDLYLVQPLKS